MSENTAAYRAEIDFPPYGKMTETHRTAMREFTFIPSDWRVPAGLPITVEEHYDKFLQQSVKIIKDILWPEFTSHGWEGNSKRNMLPLTRLDFKLLLQIQKDRRLDKSIFDKTKASTTHRELFVAEDSGPEPFGAHYDRYNDPDAAFAVTERITAHGGSGLSRKVANGPLKLKERLQRPRAYQMSLLLGVKEFTYEEAHSASTPSIFSGHCLQGVLCIGSVIEALLNSGVTITDQLLKYAVDIGDRRVFAGVHYPSDNLASWLMVMLSADFVFRNDRVKPELWRAIYEFSEVYGRIRDAHSELYQPALQAIADAASGKLGIEA